MQFGETTTADALGAILAHTIKCDISTFKKGHRLTQEDCRILQQLGVRSVMVARLDAGDLHEDEAAHDIARLLCGKRTHLTKAFTGRCNIVADRAGLAQIGASFIHELNAIDESVTVATLPPWARVAPGQVVATVKIIPFAVKAKTMKSVLALFDASASCIAVSPYSNTTFVVINTITSRLKQSVIRKTTELTHRRISAVGGSVTAVLECDHGANDVANALRQSLQERPDAIVIIGASVTVDRNDIVPSGIRSAGGEVFHFGMPVEPGNMVLLAKMQSIPVIVLPGCARSPKLNGIDWILDRYAAGMDVTREDIMSFGVGGLLVDSPHRPLPQTRTLLEGETLG